MITNCKFPLYAPLVNVNFETNTITVSVSVKAGESLGKPVVADKTVSWDEKRRLIEYKLPIIGAKNEALGKEDNEIICFTIDDAKHILSPDSKSLAGDYVGFAVKVDLPKEETQLRTESTKDDEDEGDGGRGTGIIWL